MYAIRSYYVIRDGSVITLRDGDPIAMGDVVVAKKGAIAEIVMEGSRVIPIASEDYLRIDASMVDRVQFHESDAPDNAPDAARNNFV